MWPSFHTEHPIEELAVKDMDTRLATLAFGWTLGFGYFVVWHAIQQTKRPNAFIIMCWVEILVCGIMAVICWLYLCGAIKYSFWFYFAIITTRALQVQFLFQIIVNRICIILSTPRQRFWLKFIVAAWVTVINISVYCIWIPARLRISQRYYDINLWWDRVEKGLYLMTSGILNYMFIRSIKQRLVAVGLKKYDKLVRFNEKIIALALAMDVLIIAMMSCRNDFVYMQFHPLAYMVKLEIEMCMSKLVIKVATGTGIMVYEGEALDPSSSRSKSGEDQTTRANNFTRSGQVNVRIATNTVTRTDLEGNDLKDVDLEHGDTRTRRTSAIAWEQSNRSEPIELEAYQSDAKDDDEQSGFATSNKRPRSWMEETYLPNSNVHRSRSSVAIKSPDTDLKEGDSHSDLEAEVTGGVTVSYLGAFPTHGSHRDL